MKKILFVILLLFTACFKQEPKEIISDSVVWKYCTTLPNSSNPYTKYGVAGPLIGAIENYLIIAGGANFPNKPVSEGGKKVFYSDLYLLNFTDNTLKLVNHIKLPFKVAYGYSISDNNSIYYIGGGENNKTSNKIIKLTLSKNKKNVIVKSIATLPFSFQSGVASLYNNNIYIVTGKQNGKNSNNFYKYNLSNNSLTILPNFPGSERSQSIGNILNNGKEEIFYVFGGGSKTAYLDGFGYNFKENTWKEYKKLPVSVLGGNSIKISPNKLIVIGGFNKEVWDDANLNLSSLKGEELSKYKNSYFSKKIEEYRWNKNILVYDAQKDSWNSIGILPFPAPCGEGLAKINKNIFSINGEIKPGIRSNKIYIGNLN